MKTLKTLALSAMLCFLFFTSEALYAQTKGEKAKIINQTNTSKLQKLTKSLKAKRKNEKQQALTMAKQKGWQVKGYNKNGDYYELMRVKNGVPIYYITNNVDVARSNRANTLNSGGVTGLNLNGENMVVHVWDGGHALPSHQEYGGRVSIVDGKQELNSHSGHVMGTVLGSGKDTKAKGMAPKATGYALQWTDDEIEAADQASKGMILSNHSYGLNSRLISDEWFGQYGDNAKLWDEIMYNAPYYLMVKSAGNDGDRYENSMPLDGRKEYDKLSGSTLCKNNLVVANSKDAEVSSTGELISVTRHESSSEGPADDYRIKPDIMGNGFQVYSSDTESSTAYSTKTGTSMAAPGVTGTLLLLQQHYRNLKSNFMKAATIKGLALHTADDVADVGPDAETGWGMINAKRAAEVISDDKSVIKELTLNQGEVITINVEANGVDDLLASISWTDPAGTPKSEANDKTPILVNDLDVKVSKNSTSYLPWKLTAVDKNTKGDNIVDPYERVDIKNASGTYTITISHKGTLTDEKQNFSLIVTGVKSSTVDNTLPSVPSNLQTYNVTNSSMYVKWTPSTDNVKVSGYDVFVNDEYLRTVQKPSVVLTKLSPNKNYKIKVRAVDTSNNLSEFANTSQSTSSGSATTYCVSKTDKSDWEWIKNLKFGEIGHKSGVSPEGYSDYSQYSTRLTKGQTEQIEIFKGYKYYSTSITLGVWIDWNGDGDFSDANEKAISIGSNKDLKMTGSIKVPENAKEGVTRMRVVMRYLSEGNSCGTYSSGETEDYSVVIEGETSNNPPTAPANLVANSITKNSASLSWSASTDDVAVTAYEIFVNDSSIGEVSGSTTSKSLSNLTPNTDYTAYVIAKDADGNVSEKSNTITFKTLTDGGGDCNEGKVVVELKTDNYASDISWKLLNANGEAVLEGADYQNNQLYTAEACLPKGCYKFEIKDSYGDGICCKVGNGYFKIILDGKEIMTGGDYGSGLTKEFCTSDNGGGEKPTPPSNLTALDVATTTAKLTWNASTDDKAVAGYRVYRNGTSLGDLGADVLSLNVTALSPATEYVFYVTAYDADGNESDKSNTVTITTLNENTEKELVIKLTTDRYGSETSWFIKNTEGTTVLSGSNYTSYKTYTVNETLESGCYTFTIRDSYGDGICCTQGNGSYSISIDGKEVASGGKFTKEETKEFCTTQNVTTEQLEAEVETTEFSVYPNPVDGAEVTVVMNSIEKGFLTIMDMKGAIVVKDRFSREKKVDVSKLSSGIYIIKVSGKSDTHSKKIIIK